MADYYIEADAVDAGITGAGTSGDPWTGLSGDKIIQYAIDNGTWGTAGNRLYLSTHEKYVLAAAVDYGSVFSANDTVNNPMAWIPWTGGTSNTTNIAFPSGVTVPAWELDANDAVADPVIGLNNFCSYFFGKIHDFTAQWNRGGGENLIFCEIYDGGSTADMVDGQGFQVYGCWFHSDGTVSGQDSCGVVNGLMGCLIEGFDGFGISGIINNGYCLSNVCINNDEGGIRSTNDSGIFARNTVVGNGTTGEHGLQISSLTTSDVNLAIENLIVDFSGTSGVGLSSVSGGTVAATLRNHFYNNTTNESFGDTPNYDAGGVSNTNDPLTNPATGDFSVPTNAEAYQASLTPYTENTQHSIGADQTDTGISSGGGGSLINSGLIA